MLLQKVRIIFKTSTEMIDETRLTAIAVIGKNTTVMRAKDFMAELSLLASIAIF